MSVRRRIWNTSKGAKREAWLVDYVDSDGNRRAKTFKRKKDADQFEATARVEVRDGVHVAESASTTIAEAGKLWLDTAQATGLERSTIDQRRQHLDFHIAPFLGSTTLTAFSLPMVRGFEDRLRESGRSVAMIRKVVASLGSLLADAGERGLVARNVVRDMRTRRKTKRGDADEKRRVGKLKVGVDIPSPDEIRAFVAALKGRWRPLLLTAVFTGLRASELRGLRWSDIDGKRLHVRQRVDRYNEVGRPKSAAGERTVPLPPIVVNTLTEWRDECPKSRLGLIFPNGKGNPESLANIINRGLVPAMIAAGVSITLEQGAGADAQPRAKYTGMHALRHFYASWCINRRADGGLELPPKTVQERMGHATIGLTMDVYGHLFPRGDDTEEMAAGERALLGVNATQTQHGGRTALEIKADMAG